VCVCALRRGLQQHHQRGGAEARHAIGTERYTGVQVGVSSRDQVRGHADPRDSLPVSRSASDRLARCPRARRAGGTFTSGPDTLSGTLLLPASAAGKQVARLIAGIRAAADG
jgi:hypothetical protein